MKITYSKITTAWNFIMNNMYQVWIQLIKTVVSHLKDFAVYGESGWPKISENFAEEKKWPK